MRIPINDGDLYTSNGEAQLIADVLYWVVDEERYVIDLTRDPALSWREEERARGRA